MVVDVELFVVVGVVELFDGDFVVVVVLLVGAVVDVVVVLVVDVVVVVDEVVVDVVVVLGVVVVVEGGSVVVGAVGKVVDDVGAVVVDAGTVVFGFLGTVACVCGVGCPDPDPDPDVRAKITSPTMAATTTPIRMELRGKSLLGGPSSPGESTSVGGGPSEDVGCMTDVRSKPPPAGAPSPRIFVGAAPSTCAVGPGCVVPA